jgi:hypothetical protein
MPTSEPDVINLLRLVALGIHRTPIAGNSIHRPAGARALAWFVPAVRVPAAGIVAPSRARIVAAGDLSRDYVIACECLSRRLECVGA